MNKFNLSKKQQQELSYLFNNNTKSETFEMLRFILYFNSLNIKDIDTILYLFKLNEVEK